jgi:hypothetical protein
MVSTWLNLQQKYMKLHLMDLIWIKMFQYTTSLTIGKMNFLKVITILLVFFRPAVQGIILYW